MATQIDHNSFLYVSFQICFFNSASSYRFYFPKQAVYFSLSNNLRSAAADLHDVAFSLAFGPFPWVIRIPAHSSFAVVPHIPSSTYLLISVKEPWRKLVEFTLNPTLHLSFNIFFFFFFFIDSKKSLAPESHIIYHKYFIERTYSSKYSLI